MNENLAETKSDILQLIYVEDSSKKSDLEKNIQENTDEDNGYISEYESISRGEDENKVYDTFNNNLMKYRTLREDILKSVDEGNLGEAEGKYLQISEVSDMMIDNLNKLIEVNLTDAELANNNINLIYTTSRTIMIIISIVGLILAVLIGLILSSDINKPLQIIRLFGQKLANYDLSYEFNIKRKDEFGNTGEFLFKAQNNIKELIKTIIEDSQSMSASSEELSATVEELSSKIN
jgi:methyl-accepting chemotaxis protein